MSDGVESSGWGSRMRLRYPGVCSSCGTSLPARAEALYDRASRKVRCVECPTAEVPPAVQAAARAIPAPRASGQAGASARREYERRRAKDEQKIRDRWGRFGGIAVALSEEKQSTRAWAVGALGEERVAGLLEALVSESLAVLHDRRIPGTRANIDHLVITRAGIWVIDAKRYAGRPELRVEGGILRPRMEKLMIGRRDCTNLVDGVLRQAEVVRSVAGEVPITAVLCFVDAEWPMTGGAFVTRGVHVLWPKRLTKLLSRGGEGTLDVEAVRDRLSARLKPA